MADSFMPGIVSIAPDPTDIHKVRVILDRHIPELKECRSSQKLDHFTVTKEHGLSVISIGIPGLKLAWHGQPVKMLSPGEAVVPGYIESAVRQAVHNFMREVIKTNETSFVTSIEQGPTSTQTGRIVA